METINVLVAVPFPQSIIDKLASVSPALTIHQQEVRTPQEMAEHIREMDVLYTFSVLPDPADAPRLRWVQMHTAGLDHVLAHPLYSDSEVMFTTTSGIHVVQMSEYIFSMILAFAHRLPSILEDQVAVHWTEKRWERFVPDELYDATLGIAGYGSIGRQVARLGQAFGMRVVAIKNDPRHLTLDRYVVPNTGDPEGEIPDMIYPPEALHPFLAECDYVALIVPLTGRTKHLIDEAALEAMKPSAVLINAARGDVIDEAALIKALKDGKIGGAALDVFSQEPLPSDSPLWKAPRIIISPHVGGFSHHYDERATDLFAENLRRFVAGEPLMNLVERGKDY